MSSRDYRAMKAGEFDEVVGAALRDSVQSAQPSARVRRTLLQMAASRRAQSKATLLDGSRPLHPVWSGSWVLSAIYAAYSDSHLSLMR